MRSSRFKSGSRTWNLLLLLLRSPSKCFLFMTVRFEFDKEKSSKKNKAFCLCARNWIDFILSVCHLMKVSRTMPGLARFQNSVDRRRLCKTGSVLWVFFFFKFLFYLFACSCSEHLLFVWVATQHRPTAIQPNCGCLFLFFIFTVLFIPSRDLKRFRRMTKKSTVFRLLSFPLSLFLFINFRWFWFLSSRASRSLSLCLSLSFRFWVQSYRVDKSRRRDHTLAIIGWSVNFNISSKWLFAFSMHFAVRMWPCLNVCVFQFIYHVKKKKT